MRTTFVGGVCQMHGNAGKVKDWCPNYRGGKKAEGILARHFFTDLQ